MEALLPFALALALALLAGIGEAASWRVAGRHAPAGGAFADDRIAWASLAMTVALAATPMAALLQALVGLGPSVRGLSATAAGLMLAALVALAVWLPGVMRLARADLDGPGERLGIGARPALGLAMLLGATKVWATVAGLGLAVLGSMPAPPAGTGPTAQVFVLMMALGLAASWAVVMWPVWRGEWAGGRAALRALRRGGVLVAILAAWLLLSALQGISSLAVL